MDKRHDFHFFAVPNVHWMKRGTHTQKYTVPNTAW